MMGMFDYIELEVPLPDGSEHEDEYQTKSTPYPHLMDTYVIRADGRLVHKTTQWVSVPEEERAYFGTPEWDERPFVRLMGSMRSVPTGDVVLEDFHGDILFYGNNQEWIARFTNGYLQDIRPPTDTP